MNTENRKVVVKSMANYQVGFTMPELRFKRVFAKENETKQIEFNILEEGLSTLGIRTLFDEGILVIENEQDRIDLGLQEGPNDAARFKILNHGQILKLLKIDSAATLENTLSTLPREQILRIADVAISEKFTDYEKCQIIKKYCGIDVITSVQNGADEE